jgi:hypothetical protein
MNAPRKDQDASAPRKDDAGAPRKEDAAAPRTDHVSAPRDESGIWRDPNRLPLGELDRALAQYSYDGHIDDPTGGDAGSEQEFGDMLRYGKWPTGPDPDPDTEEGRRLRPSFEGQSGPG